MYKNEERFMQQTKSDKNNTASVLASWLHSETDMTMKYVS